MKIHGQSKTKASDQEEATSKSAVISQQSSQRENRQFKEEISRLQAMGDEDLKGDSSPANGKPRENQSSQCKGMPPVIQNGKPQVNSWKFEGSFVQLNVYILLLDMLENWSQWTMENR